ASGGLPDHTPTAAQTARSRSLPPSAARTRSCPPAAGRTPRPCPATPDRLSSSPPPPRLCSSPPLPVLEEPDCTPGSSGYRPLAANRGETARRSGDRSCGSAPIPVERVRVRGRGGRRLFRGGRGVGSVLQEAGNGRSHHA